MSNKIATAATNLCESLELLYDKLSEECELLKKNNSEEIESIACEKDTLIKIVTKTSNGIAEILLQNNLQFNNEGLTTLAKQYSLEDVFAKIINLLKNIRIQNEHNGMLLVTKYNFNNQLLNIITNNTHQNNTYSANKNIKNKVSTRDHKA